MCGVPPYAVTAMNTHAAYPPHCTSPRLLRVWGHATGRPRAAYHTRTPERAPDRGGKRGVPWLHTLCGVRYAMPHRVSTPPEQGSPRYGGDRIASIRIGRSVTAMWCAQPFIPPTPLARLWRPVSQPYQSPR